MRSVRPGRGVEHAAAGGELAGVDAEVGQLADVGVGHHLEGEGGEGGVVVGGALGLGRPAVLALLGGLEPLDGGHLERRGEQLDDRVEQRLDALVLEGGAAEDRRDLDVEGGPVQGLDDPLVRDLLVVQVGLHAARRRSRRRPRSGGCGARGRGPTRSSGISVYSNSVPSSSFQTRALFSIRSTTPTNSASCADRDLDRERVGAEPVAHRLDRLEEVGAGAVHLVDVGDPRHAVLVGLAPDGLGLRLDAGHGVEQRDRAVEDAEAALDLDGEVDVARACRGC